jgi:hypothetical protein
MAYKDGEVFETYCDKPYDRSVYKVYLKDGQSVIYENYELMRYHWYQQRAHLSHVEVLDAPKSTAGKGF